MIYYYRRVPYSDFENLRGRLDDDPDAISDVLWPDTRFIYDPPGMEIGVEGAGDLHHVLSQERSIHKDVFQNILRARSSGAFPDCLDPQQVKELTDALDSLTYDQLKSLYDPEALNWLQNDRPGYRSDANLAIMWTAVENLRTFLHEALFFSEVVVCWPD